jgi:hypothetical protein
MFGLIDAARNLNEPTSEMIRFSGRFRAKTCRFQPPRQL